MKSFVVLIAEMTKKDVIKTEIQGNAYDSSYDRKVDGCCICKKSFLWHRGQRSYINILNIF